MRTVGYILVLLLIFNNAFSQVQNEGWKFRKNEEGIVVYTKVTKGSNIVEVRAMTEFDSPIDPIVAVFLDGTSYPEWAYGCVKTEVIKKVSKSEYYYYNKTDVPWPASDRDLIMRLTVTKDNKTGEVTCLSVAQDDQTMSSPEIVRMTEMKILWKLIPVSEDKTRILYYSAGDPVGDAPEWILELFMVAGPYNTLKNLKKIIKEDKFKNAKLDIF